MTFIERKTDARTEWPEAQENDQWMELSSLLLMALGPFPDARKAVLEVLQKGRPSGEKE